MLFSKYFFYWESILIPLPGGRIFNSEFFRDLNQGSYFPIKRNPHGIPLISRLLLHICPSAIVGRIRSVNVNSVEREFSSICVIAIPGRSCPSAERTVIIPLITDRYPAASIIAVCVMIFVQAPLSHAVPDCVKPCSKPSVLLCPCTNSLLLEAPARSSVSTQQRCFTDRFSITTITDAVPHSFRSAGPILLVWSSAFYDKPPKPLSRYINNKITPL